MVTTVLLPGLDGTARLFAPLLPHLRGETAPVPYPTDRVLDLDGYAALVRAQLPDGEPFVIVAESFSGQVALRVAASRPEKLVALVLVATFVTPPLAAPLRSAP